MSCTLVFGGNGEAAEYNSCIAPCSLVAIRSSAAAEGRASSHSLLQGEGPARECYRAVYFTLFSHCRGLE